jgi:hypothetical protein
MGNAPSNPKEAFENAFDPNKNGFNKSLEKTKSDLENTFDPNKNQNLKNFGEDFVNGLSGIVNVAGNSIGLPDIPKLGDRKTLFGHGEEEKKKEKEKEKQKQENERAQTLQNIKSIPATPLSVPDVKPSGAGGSQNFTMPPVYVPQGTFVDKQALKEAQEQAILETQLLYGMMGTGGLLFLFMLKQNRVA